MRLLYDSTRDKGAAEASFTMSATDTVTPSTYTFPLNSYALGAQGYRPDIITTVFTATTDLVGAGTLTVQAGQNYLDESGATIRSNYSRLTAQKADELAQDEGVGDVTIASGAGDVDVWNVEWMRVGGSAELVGFTGDELILTLANTSYTAGVVDLYIRLYAFVG
jgi:hypothetical protein